MEIKLERFSLERTMDDAYLLEAHPEGEYVRFSDVLTALRGLIAITDDQLTAAFDDGRAEGYDDGYIAGQEDCL